MTKAEQLRTFLCIAEQQTAAPETMRAVLAQGQADAVRMLDLIVAEFGGKPVGWSDAVIDAAFSRFLDRQTAALRERGVGDLESRAYCAALALAFSDRQQILRREEQAADAAGRH